MITSAKNWKCKNMKPRPIPPYLFVVSFYTTMLFMPTASWAIGEAADTPLLPSPTTTLAPAQISPDRIPEPATPPKPVALPAIPLNQTSPAATPVKPAPVPVTAAKPVPVPTPVPVTAAKPGPAPVPATATQPVTAPTPVPATVTKPAPAPTQPGITTGIATQTVDIEVFLRDGCLNCDKATEFLQKLHNLQPQLKINIRDVRKEPAALELLKRVAQNQGGSTLDYPAFVVGGHLIMGFSEEASTAQNILDNLPLTHSTGTQSGDGVENCGTGKEPGCGLIPPSLAAKTEKISLNLFGYSIPLVQIGLPLFTVVMGLLDGLNHGSTWVLLLMISLLTPMKDRSLVLIIGGTFIAVKALIYFILIAVWFKLFQQIEISRLTQLTVAGIALIAGVIYFKKYIQYGQKISISVNEITKPGIYTRIRKIVQSDSLLTALLGTVILSFIVQIGEFTITTIFPAFYTRILTLHHLDQFSNLAYLLLYDLAYMLDDVIILAVCVFTLNQPHPKSSRKELLKLASALTLFGVAIYLLLVKY